MEVHSFTNINMHYLLSFVFNKLSKPEMDKFELFLQKNDFYADIVDDLIDLVTVRNFTFEEVHTFLKKKNTNNLLLKSKLKLNFLYNSFNKEKISLSAFEESVKQWFAPAPPTQYGVALMSSNIQITSPINKKNYLTEVDFKLAQPVATGNKIYLNIFESNNEKPVIETEIDTNISSYKINIKEKMLHPGIYYWRMQALQTGVKAEGEFYVNKQLNPFEENI